MISALQIAKLCDRVYTETSGWDRYWTINDVVIAHQVVDGVDVFVLRGSKEAIDWMRDAAAAIPVWHSQLGFVAAGFIIGIDEVFDVILPVIKAGTGKVAICGHSLGGSRARLLAAKCVVNGVKVDYLCVIGSPKPGFANVRRVIEKSGMVHESFRNRNDPVPLVPGLSPMWEHTEPWQAVSSAPAPDDVEPLRDHHAQLYIKGIEQLPQTLAAAPGT